MVVVAYDIAGNGKAAARRLRQISRLCDDFGVRVQRSLYECKVNAEQLQGLTDELHRIMDPDHDSIRIYRLGKHYKERSDSFGRDLVEWDRDTFVL